MESLPLLQGTPIAPQRVRYFYIAFIVAGSALFAATWKLWIPQQVFPQIPWFAFVGNLPTSIQYVLFTVALGALTSLGVLAVGSKCCSQRLTSSALLTFAASTTLLLLVDQHRLQPWAYQLVIFAIVLAALPAARAFVLLRWLVVSIYFWSAVAKLDYSFADTLGQQFLLTGTGLVGLHLETWSPTLRHGAALAFPLAELIIAAGFCLPLRRITWLRRVVLSLVVAMHVTLIIVLSPLGLNHQPAVMLWNVWFIVQAFLLFGFPEAQPEQPTAKPSAAWQDLSGVLVEFLVAAVILLPALTLVNRFDHWPAWGLYAPRNSRATLYIQQSVVERLPPKLSSYLGEAPRGDGWRQLRIDAWSLDALAVPIYPQDRFQVAVADAVIRNYDLHNDFQLIIAASPDRWTGRRATKTIRTRGELDAHRRGYYLNTSSANGD